MEQVLGSPKDQSLKMGTVMGHRPHCQPHQQLVIIEMEMEMEVTMVVAIIILTTTPLWNLYSLLSIITKYLEELEM